MSCHWIPFCMSCCVDYAIVEPFSSCKVFKGAIADNYDFYCY